MEKILLTIDAKLLKDPALDALFKKLGITHDIKVNTKGASSSMKRLYESINSGFMQFGLFSSGVSRATQLVQGFANAIIKPAADIEILKLRLTSLYGSTSAAAQAFKTFQDIATRTPATLQQVVEAGASLKAFGLDAEAALESVSDLAAFMGMDVVEASQAVGRAFAGGAGAAEILRERGVLELIKSFKGIDDLTSLTLPEFRQVLLETLSDPAAGIAGSADRISKSYTGAMSNLNDSFTTLRANIGSQLTPTLSALANGLSDIIKGLNGTGSNLQTATREASSNKITFDSLIITYTDLHNKQNRSATDNQIYRDTIRQLLDIYPNYFQNINLEKDSWQKISTAIDTARTSLNNYLNLQILVATRKDFEDQISSVALKIADTTAEVAKLQAIVNSGRGEENSRGLLGLLGDFTYGEDLANKQAALQNLIAEENALRNALQQRIVLTQKLYKIEETPAPKTKTETGSNSSVTAPGSTGSAPLKIVDEAAQAHEQLTRFLASETELVNLEYKRLINLAKAAYDITSKEYTDAEQKIGDWRDNKHLEITERMMKELADTDAKKRSDILANYNAEIERLADLKTIGALTYDELTSKLSAYALQIKEVFGPDSKEYAAALDSLQTAQLRISQTLVQAWRQDNAEFLRLWDASSSALVSGFDAAWSSILDSSISGSQRLNNIWAAMRSSFLSSVGSMAAGYIKSKLTQLAIELTVEKSKQAAILTTLGIQKSALVVAVAGGIKAAFAGLFEAVGNIWKWWTTLIPPPFSVAAAIATGAAMISAFNGVKKSLGFAQGGMISGPGSATSDSIPIMASNGEYVVNAQAVSAPGVLPLLNYINANHSSAQAPLPIPGHYASGGIVSAPAFPGLADLISEVRLLRQDVYRAQPTFINHAPNPIEIHKQGEIGRKLYKGY
ncbi:MAG TPA: hypothetical protein P5533_01480 [Candidatus Cloacimonadota bacterium]|nr:hypothetical protein [Candidatus Cloacimonadota bacterium]